MNLMKDPDSVLDYRWDWSGWLEDDETIDSFEIVTDVTVDSSNEDGGMVTAWLSQASPGTRRVTCRVNTSKGRTDDRTIVLTVSDR